MVVKFRPLNDMVMVEPDKAVNLQSTASGILVTIKNPERKYCGIVLAVGSDPQIPVKVGDHVWYDKGVQYTVDFEGHTYDFVSCFDLIAASDN